MKRIIPSIVKLTLCSFFLSGCTVMTTSPNPTIEKGYVDNKIPYFLPTGRLKVSMFTPDGTNECKLKVEEIYLAERLLFLEYNPSIWSSDTDITIRMSSEGFLTEINSKTKDATPEIIAGLAKIAKMAMGIPAPAGSNFLTTPCKLDLTFNPFNNAEIQAVLAKVKQQNSNIEDFILEPMFSKNGSMWNLPAVGTPIPDILSIETGIVYLTRLPYKFTIKTLDSSIQPSQIIYLPNESPAFVLDIKRKAFIENSVNITFENGMFTQVKWTKPSEALGFINIPIEVGKAIMSIPGELLTLKVNDLNAEKGLLEAQKNHIEAQLQLIKKKAELEENN